MKLLLDSNICIYIIKQRPPNVLAKFKEHSPGEIGVSPITVTELQYGIWKSQQKKRNQQALNQFLFPLVIANFDNQAAAAYGEIRSKLDSQGTPIRSLDTLIAAHALSLEMTLVTNTIRESGRISGLTINNWAL